MLFFEYLRKHFTKNTVLPVMSVGFADVPVVSERIVDTDCDVVDSSVDSVNDLISTSTAFPKFCSQHLL